jgi:hypothetical protein
MQEGDLSLDDLPEGLRKVWEYWRELGGGTLGCSWRDFDLQKIPLDLLPSTMIIDVWEDQDRNRYRFWGTQMTRIHGRDMTGKSPYDISPSDLGKTLRRQHKTTVQNGKASASIYGFKRAGGFEHFHQVLRLPLSDDGKNVNQLAVIIDLTAAPPEYQIGLMSAAPVSSKS